MSYEDANTEGLTLGVAGLCCSRNGFAAGTPERTEGSKKEMAVKPQLYSRWPFDNKPPPRLCFTQRYPDAEIHPMGS